MFDKIIVFFSSLVVLVCLGSPTTTEPAVAILVQEPSEKQFNIIPAAFSKSDLSPPVEAMSMPTTDKQNVAADEEMPPAGQSPKPLPLGFEAKVELAACDIKIDGGETVEIGKHIHTDFSTITGWPYPQCTICCRAGSPATQGGSWRTMHEALFWVDGKKAPDEDSDSDGGEPGYYAKQYTCCVCCMAKRGCMGEEAVSRIKLERNKLEKSKARGQEWRLSGKNLKTEFTFAGTGTLSLREKRIVHRTELMTVFRPAKLAFQAKQVQPTQRHSTGVEHDCVCALHRMATDPQEIIRLGLEAIPLIGRLFVALRAFGLPERREEPGGSFPLADGRGLC